MCIDFQARTTFQEDFHPSLFREVMLGVVVRFTQWFQQRQEGGFRGGNIIASGTPEEVAKCENSFTGQFIKEMLEKA